MTKIKFGSPKRKRQKKRLTFEEARLARAEYQRMYYLAHRDKAREYQRLYNLTHKKKKLPGSGKYAERIDSITEHSSATLFGRDNHMPVEKFLKILELLDWSNLTKGDPKSTRPITYRPSVLVSYLEEMRALTEINNIERIPVYISGKKKDPFRIAYEDDKLYNLITSFIKMMKEAETMKEVIEHLIMLIKPLLAHGDIEPMDGQEAFAYMVNHKQFFPMIAESITMKQDHVGAYLLSKAEWTSAIMQITVGGDPFGSAINLCRFLKRIGMDIEIPIFGIQFGEAQGVEIPLHVRCVQASFELFSRNGYDLSEFLGMKNINVVENAAIVASEIEMETKVEFTLEELLKISEEGIPLDPDLEEKLGTSTSTIPERSSLREPDLILIAAGEKGVYEFIAAKTVGTKKPDLTLVALELNSAVINLTGSNPGISGTHIRNAINSAGYKKYFEQRISDKAGSVDQAKNDINDGSGDKKPDDSGKKKSKTNKKKPTDEALKANSEGKYPGGITDVVKEALRFGRSSSQIAEAINRLCQKTTGIIITSKDVTNWKASDPAVKKVVDEFKAKRAAS